MNTDLKLGLIGLSIEQSRSPALHCLAGRLSGISVTYDLIRLDSAIPESFDKMLSLCQSQKYYGVNVTYPFKERAAEVARIESEQVRRLGAVNTVRFVSESEMQGFNTDFTGFKRAFDSRYSGQPPGKVALIGAGGIGRAIAFGLVDLGAEELRIFDQEAQKAESLALTLKSRSELQIRTCATLEDTVSDVEGIVNATPIGMYNHPGTAIPRAMVSTQSWAFDAVYTPVETQFLLEAKEAGLETLSGYELFIYQGIEAFKIFSGVYVDESRLRAGLTQ